MMGIPLDRHLSVQSLTTSPIQPFHCMPMCEFVTPSLQQGTWQQGPELVGVDDTRAYVWEMGHVKGGMRRNLFKKAKRSLFHIVFA